MLIPLCICVPLWNRDFSADWQVRNSDRCLAAGLLLGCAACIYQGPWENIFSRIKNHATMNSFFSFWFLQPEPKGTCIVGSSDWGGCQLLFSYSLLRLLLDGSLLSVSGARGQRETVEASPGCADWEGPSNLWQHATEEGSLVQPSLHVPSSCHQVAMVLCPGMMCGLFETILINYNYFNIWYYDITASSCNKSWEFLQNNSHTFLAIYW